MPTKTTASLKSFLSDLRIMPALNYLFVFVMVLSVGLSGIVALLVANFFEEKAADWIKTHYEFQKRTFWIGILPVLLVSFALLRLHVTDERILLVVLAVPLGYTAGRAAFGFNHLFHERPIPNPKAWIV